MPTPAHRPDIDPADIHQTIGADSDAFPQGWRREVGTHLDHLPQQMSKLAVQGVCQGT